MMLTLVLSVQIKPSLWRKLVPRYMIFVLMLVFCRQDTCRPSHWLLHGGGTVDSMGMYPHACPSHIQ